MAIDPTARVAQGARIGEGVEIGPYCVIGPQVELGRGVRLIAHVHITGATSIGEGVVVYPFASLGTPPQSVHYRGGPTRLIIGARCELRESVTMNTGTEDAGGVTRVGDRCFFMVGAHVGHDCALGSDVTLANNVVLGGHVTIGDWVTMGGFTGVHQFCRVGAHAMVAAGAIVLKDVPPFATVAGYPARPRGINSEGLRRRGFSTSDIATVRRAYRTLYRDGLALEDAMTALRSAAADAPALAPLIQFLAEPGRGLVR